MDLCRTLAYLEAYRPDYMARFDQGSPGEIGFDPSNLDRAVFAWIWTACLGIYE
jgi:hypothetical protein